MKPFLLITGMHRSGTSFLARALNLYGVYLGELDSLLSHEWKVLADNPKGNWENQKIYELSEKTLGYSKGSWHKIPRKVTVNKKIGTELKKCINKLEKKSILASGFKDPRLILCFEAWKKYFPKNFVIIGIFRHPIKVAESLKTRDSFSYEKSLNLWKKYNQNLIQILEKYDGFLLDFDLPKNKLLTQVELISKKLGLANNVDLTEWYSKELLHSNKTYQKNYVLPTDIKLLYSKLQKRSKKNKYVKTRNRNHYSKEISSDIGNLLKNLQNQSKDFSKIFNDRDAELKQKILELTKLQKEYDERSKWALELDKKLKQREETINKIQNQYDERSKWALELDKKLKQRDEINTKLQNQYDEILKIEHQHRDEKEKLNRSLDDTQKSVKIKESELGDLRIKVKDKDSEINKIQATLQTKDSEINKIQATLQTKDSQIQNFQTELESTQHVLDLIQNSVMFGITSGIARSLDKIAPKSTRRGNTLRMVSDAYMTKKKSGSKTLLKAVKSKISKKLEIKNSRAIPKVYLQPIEVNKDLQSYNMIMIKEKFAVDSSLREFLRFGSHNITNLPSFPKISIIIITLDQVDALKRNLASIEEISTYKNYEIIIVTNNHDENSEMRKFLKGKKYPVWVYDSSYSFGGMNNFGATKAKGEFLLFLNDDVKVISPNWLEAFLSLALKKSTGVVGGKLLSSDGKLQDCGGIVWRDGNAWNYGRGHDPDDPKFNYVRDGDYCSGSCLFVKTEIFNQVGGFDTSFHPAYWEDVDLCFSIRKLGYKILYQPLAKLIHYEGMTQGTSTDKGLKSYQIENQKKFHEKWKPELDYHLNASIENALLECDRKDGLNILYIDHYIPEPDQDGGSLRALRILGILASMGNKITFWPDNLNYTRPYGQELQQKGIEVIYGANEFEKFLDERKHVYDLVITTRPYISVKYIELIKSKMPNCKIIYDTIDLHFLRMARSDSLENKTDTKETEEMRQLELSLMRKSDITILTSIAEAKVLHKEDDSLKFSFLPTIHIEPKSIEKFEKRKNLLFVGGFQHTPNIDAAEFLVHEIWPIIKQKISGVKLYIVGTRPTENIKKLASDDVIVTGYVKDLSPYYQECKVLLAPIRFGAGIKIKIIQSLAMGLPVVTTPIAVEGTSLIDSKNCMIAEKPKDFANKIAQVYADKELWNKISVNGSELAKEYSPEKAQACLKATISSILTDE